MPRHLDCACFRAGAKPALLQGCQRLQGIPPHSLSPFPRNTGELSKAPTAWLGETYLLSQLFFFFFVENYFSSAKGLTLSPPGTFS